VRKQPCARPVRQLELSTWTDQWPSPAMAPSTLREDCLDAAVASWSLAARTEVEKSWELGRLPGTSDEGRKTPSLPKPALRMHIRSNQRGRESHMLSVDERASVCSCLHRAMPCNALSLDTFSHA
jgi:hypothetical protein